MFTLDQIVPWGRSFDEYRQMFALDDLDLSRRIIGCADGPANFNAEATRRNGQVVSCDPLYEFSREQIQARIAAVRHQVLEQTRQHQENFNWGDVGSVEQLERRRMDAMESFLADYESGKKAGRYIQAALPELPFPDTSFDIALCSHFLFLYSDHLSVSFHIQAVQELCRVAADVRIFPLLTLASQRSNYLEPVMAAVTDAGWTARIEPVAYHFQRNAHEMLRIRRE